MPFGGFVNIAPHFGGDILPKTLILGREIGVFNPNGQNITGPKMYFVAHLMMEAEHYVIERSWVSHYKNTVSEI